VRAAVLRTLASAVTPVACFSGADALGLPCDKDVDCGEGQRCEMNVCGGPPATTTSSGSSESSGEESSSTGIPASCGNGMVEPDAGEECEPATPENTAACDADCTLPLCGDNWHNPANELAPGLFEECDAGPDGADDCDVDCTLVVCGDGITNAIAGEQCDEGEDTDDLDACTPQCFTTLFVDDLGTDPDRTGNWTTDKPEITNTCDDDPDPFMLTTSGWVWAPGSWSSGPEPTMQSGSSRLISREVAIPTELPAAARVELRFTHRYVFGTCGMAQAADGGIVEIEADGTAMATAPIAGYPGELSDGGDCLAIDRANNPLVPLDGCLALTAAAYVGALPVAEQDRVDIDGYRGQSVRAIFHMGFDCSGACAEEYEGWTLSDVVVAPYCEPTPGCPDGSAICCGDP
jgi:hypothetical protein